MPKGKKTRTKKDSPGPKGIEQFSSSIPENYDENISLEMSMKINSSGNNMKKYFDQWTRINKEGSEICKLIISANNVNGKSSHDVSKLQELYLTLEEKFKELEEIHKKLNQLTEKITQLIHLNNFQLQSTNAKKIVSDEMMGFSGVANQLDILATASKKISAAYEEELKLKKIIIENLSLESNSDNSQFMEMCWTYEPFIDDDVHLAFAETLLLIEQNSS